MSDSIYNHDFLLEHSLEPKQETPFELETMSASVPIPQRRTDICDFSTEIDLCLQDSQVSTFHSVPTLSYSKFSFDTESPRMEPFKMEDDDIFQVDKADLIMGPTLAELNANPDTLLDDLNFDDLLLPEESGYCIQIGGAMSGSRRVNTLPSPHTLMTESPCSPCGQTQHEFSPSSQHSSASSSVVPPMNQLPELLLRMDGYCGEIALGQSVPASSVLPPFHSGVKTQQQLSSSAPTHLTMDQYARRKFGFDRYCAEIRNWVLTNQRNQKLGINQSEFGYPCAVIPSTRRSKPNSRRAYCTLPHIPQIWQRREPRKHLLSTSSLAEAGSASSLSGGLLSSGAGDLSQDEDDWCIESDEDSDRYEDLSSDDSNDECPEKKEARQNAKRERYFWQYNVQAKGPKGQRLILKKKSEDPHVLNSVTDPVFSPNCNVKGIKHSGKARKGDGNDLTPNPRKLYLIGLELDKLGKVINDMTPVSELPFNVRPKTRKEKNKLASRACRLKKKAQHEANKLKLYGLQQEHKRLMNGINQLKQIVNARVTNPDNTVDWSTHINGVIDTATEVKIAGKTSEYVNTILDNVKSGQNNGGLTDM